MERDKRNYPTFEMAIVSFEILFRRPTLCNSATVDLITIATAWLTSHRMWRKTLILGYLV